MFGNISRRVDCEVVGTVPWYPEMRNHRVANGRFFNDGDMDSQTSVCVLGAEMVPALFPLESPLGKHVRVGGDYYQVIGIMEPRGQGPKGDETQDATKSAAHRMFIPLETAKLRYGEVLMRRRSGSFEAERIQLHEVTVKVESLDSVTGVAEAVKTVARKKSQKEGLRRVSSRSNCSSAPNGPSKSSILFWAPIAAISLLVGGIGYHEHHCLLASRSVRARSVFAAPWGLAVRTSSPNFWSRLYCSPGQGGSSA